MISQFLYNIAISLMGLIMRIASFFVPKAKLWVGGRKHTMSDIQKVIKKEDKVVWLHAASLGEYEQGIPILNKLKEKHPDYKFAVSFFSPSGYEVIKKRSWVDIVFYLPVDRKKNTRELLDVLHPELVIFVKYEFWYNLLQELQKREIKTLFISVIFRKNQIYFKSLGKWFVSVLKGVNHFFVQNYESEQLLKSVGITQVSISGDTRFDRVKELLDRDNTLEFVREFKDNKKLIVAGSTWKKDDKTLLKYINSKQKEQDVKMLIAPHNMDAEYFQELKQSINLKTILLSEMKPNENLSEYDVLILDAVGYLTKVYSYADIAYVGGGLTKGIHNVLEPAVFGIPVVHGPKYYKFLEAMELLEEEGSIIVNKKEQIVTILSKLVLDKEYREEVGARAKKYIMQKPNSTEMILKNL